jgi:hypothetical protein
MRATGNGPDVPCGGCGHLEARSRLTAAASTSPDRRPQLACGNRCQVNECANERRETRGPKPSYRISPPLTFSLQVRRASPVVSCVDVHLAMIRATAAAAHLINDRVRRRRITTLLSLWARTETTLNSGGRMG